MKKLILMSVLLLCVCCVAFAETTEVILTCTGDFMPGSNDRVKTEEYAFQRYIEKYGYGYPFEKLQGLFANDDITLVNLECMLNDSAPDNTSRLRFRGPEEYANIFPACSIEVANLANNHSSDFGKEAYDTTIAALDGAGVQYCGTIEYGNHACYMEVKGVRIGFVGVYPLYYKDHPEELEECFQQLKDAGCQVIVASLHCGAEYNATHGNIHDRYGKILRNLGAHIIVGNHPHVPQGFNVFDGITQIYSLGNASFGGNTGVDEEMHEIRANVAQFRLVFEDGQYTGHQLTLWPIHISGVTPENNYQPVLVEGDAARKVMARVKKDSIHVRVKDYVDGQGAVQAFVPWEK